MLLEVEPAHAIPDRGRVSHEPCSVKNHPTGRKYVACPPGLAHRGRHAGRTLVTPCARCTTGSFIKPLGLPGAPVALLSAFGVGIVAAVIGLGRKNSIVRLSRRGFCIDFPFLRGIASSSALAGMSPLLNVTTVVVLTGFIAKFGDAALAGYGIGSRLEFLIIPLVFGIGTALTTLVGGNIGAGQLDRAHKVAWVGACAAMVLAGLVGIFFAVFPQAWADHFSKNSEVLASAHAFLQIAGPGFPFLALGLALFFASQGANRVGWSVIAAALRLIVVVAGANLLLTASGAGIETLYLLVFFGMVVYGSTNALAVWKGAWADAQER